MVHVRDARTANWITSGLKYLVADRRAVDEVSIAHENVYVALSEDRLKRPEPRRLLDDFISLSSTKRGGTIAHYTRAAGAEVRQRSYFA